MKIVAGIVALAVGLAAAGAFARGSSPGAGSDQDVADFAMDTETEVRSVLVLDTAPLDVRLDEARTAGQSWGSHPVLAAVHLCRDAASAQSMSIHADFEPGERDMNHPIERARVVVEDEGWADDSVFGQRHVLYFTRDGQGRLRVERALRAMLCSRPGQQFYSADPCP